MQRGLQCVDASAAAVVVSQVRAEAAKFMTRAGSFSTGVMDTVEFQPDKVGGREDGMVSFPWRVRRGMLNGFNTAHGGALATLADVFTRIHLNTAVPDRTASTISFEISYLSGIAENTACACVTRFVGCNATDVQHMDYFFEDEKTGQIYARGTHVLSCRN